MGKKLQPLMWMALFQQNASRGQPTVSNLTTQLNIQTFYVSLH
jgi:hypothetical protein